MKSQIILTFCLLSFSSMAAEEVIECVTHNNEVHMSLKRSDKVEHKTNRVWISINKTEAYKAKALTKKGKVIAASEDVGGRDEVVSVENVSLDTEEYSALISAGTSNLTNSANVFVGKMERSKKLNGGHSDSLLIHLERTLARVAWDNTVYYMNCAAKVE